MKLRERIARLLNPRADLSRLRHTSPRAEVIPERRIRLRHVLFNFPLLVGGLIVLALFVGVLFGPVLAPKNPYLHGRHLTEYVDGVLTSPPFPPSPQYPLGTDELGRDTMSMLLYGTRNTLVAAAFITMARLLLGVALGGLAGWNEGRLVDQIVMGTIQMLISLPMLLVAMILIFALDIRRGLPVFIVALCAVGWGEIAQYTRAEFIHIKQEPFLDSGRVVGLNSLELAIRHILPNVLPALIVITLLEMGAVLMILGELGFIGVYIGGGTTIQVVEHVQRQYFSLPEWGAMMAGSRAWARGQPWMIMSPAVAFFVSVTGFNLLGEGLRRLIERGIFNTALLLSWRALVVIALITTASMYVIVTLGPAPSYRQLAQQIGEADLVRHVEFLSADRLNGRGVGSPGAREAAQYIADELESYGLTPPPGGWLREMPLTLARLAESPELSLVDEAGRALTTFTRLVDYGETVEYHGGSGQAEAPVTLVLFPPSGDSSQRSENPVVRQEAYARFKRLDLRGRIAMVIADNAPGDFSTEALIRGAQGVLIVSDDVRPFDQIPAASLTGDYLERPPLPVFRITPATANTILATSPPLGGTEGGDALEATRAEIAAWDTTEPPWIARELDAQVRMSVQFEPPETVTAHNVMWLLNGSDAAMARDLIIVSCHYDGLGRAPDGTLYPGANGNGSGVAALLEIARLWQEQEFAPRRSVLFAAWAGGELPYSGAHHLLDMPNSFLERYNIVAVIHLDRLGSESGEGLVVHPVNERDTLFDLLASSAEGMEVQVARGSALRHPYQQLFNGRLGTLVVTWGNPRPAFDGDTPDLVNPQHLSQAVQVVNLTLITAAHEPTY
jgi:ABC-type dipeptide/oligopeptide/nickel transport system permease subunit